MIQNSLSQAAMFSSVIRLIHAFKIKRRIAQLAGSVACLGLVGASALAQTSTPLVLPNTFMTVAGSNNGSAGNTGFTVGQACSPGSPLKATDIYGDGCLATQAVFGTDLQDGVRVDGQGNIFIADINNNWSGASVQLLRRVDAQTGIVTAVSNSLFAVCKAATTTTAGQMDKEGSGCPFANTQAQKERGWGIDPYGNIFTGAYASGDSVHIYCNAVSPLCPIAASATQTYSTAQKQVGYMYRIAGCVTTPSGTSVASGTGTVAGGAGDGYFASAFTNLPGDVAAWGPSNAAFPATANITGNGGTCGSTTGEFNGGRAVAADLYGNVYLNDGGSLRTRVIVGPPTFTFPNGTVLTNPLPAVIAMNPTYSAVTAAQMYGRVYPINGGFTATVAAAACPGAATATAVDAYGDGCPWYNSAQSSANPVGLAVDQTVEGGVASPNPIFLDGNLSGLRVIYMGATVSAGSITAAAYPMAYAILVNNPTLTSVTRGYTYLLAGNSTGAMTAAPSLGTLTSMSGYGRLSPGPNGNLYLSKASNTAAAVALYDLSTGYVRLLLQSTGSVTGSVNVVPGTTATTIYTCPTLGAGDGQPAFSTGSTYSAAAMTTTNCFNDAGTGSSTLSISVDSKNNLYLGDVEIDSAGYGRSRIREVLAAQLYPTTIGTPLTQSLYLHSPVGTVAGATALAASALDVSPGEISVATPTCGTSSNLDQTVDCLANVTFSPAAPGVRGGSLAVTGSSAGATSNTPIAGFATGSALATDPSSPIAPITSNVVAAKALPAGVAVDANGDVFTVDTSVGKFTEISGGVTTQLPGTAPTSPTQLALDPYGNLYAGGVGSTSLTKLTLTGNTYTASTVTIGGIAAPQGITFDKAGNLYVADKTTASVYKVTAATLAGTSVPSINGVLPTGTPASLVATGLGNPTSLAIDSLGNLYIGDPGGSAIFRVDGSTGALSSLLSSVHPVSVAVDAAGDVYYQDSSSLSVIEVPYAGIVNGGAGSQAVTILSGLTKPSGVAIAGNGNAYSADTSGALTLVARGAFSFNFGTGSAGSATLNGTLTDVGNLVATGTNPSINTTNIVVSSSGSNACSVSNGILGAQSIGSACTFVANFVGLGNGTITDNISYLPAASTTGSLVLSGTLTSISGTTTSLANIGSTVLPGATITLTATVASTAAVANQTVTFLNGATTLGTGTTNASGVVSYTLTAGALGTVYNFQATFAGTTSLGASASPVQTVMVALAPSAITLALSTNLTYPGQPVTLTATQTPAAVGQTISFLSGATVLGTGVISSTGVATYIFTPTTGGTYSLTASYASDGKAYAASVSTAQTLTVASAAILFSASPNPLNVAPGATGQVALSISPQGGFSGLIGLSCSSPVKYVTCGIQFTSVTVQQDLLNPTATITVAPTTSTLTQSSKGTVLAMLAPFGLLGLALVSRKQKRKLQRVVLAVLFALCGGMLTLSMSGCSSGTTVASGPAPTGTQVVTFSATAGGATQTATVTVNIN